MIDILTTYSRTITFVFVGLLILGGGLGWFLYVVASSDRRHYAAMASHHQRNCVVFEEINIEIMQLLKELTSGMFTSTTSLYDRKALVLLLTILDKSKRSEFFTVIKITLGDEFTTKLRDEVEEAEQRDFKTD